MEEIWKDVPEYEGVYQASNMGNVRSLDRYAPHNRWDVKQGLKGKMIAQNKTKFGYFSLKLSRRSYQVHRIIAKTFIPNPENKPQVNHINGIKTYNRVENLEWCTSKENVKHSYEIGLASGSRRRGSKNGQSKLIESDVVNIRLMYRQRKMSAGDLSELYNVSLPCIWQVIWGKSWKHVATDTI